MGALVQIPGVGNVQFPSSMSPSDIDEASHHLYTATAAEGIEKNPPGVPKPSNSIETQELKNPSSPNYDADASEGNKSFLDKEIPLNNPGKSGLQTLGEEYLNPFNPATRSGLQSIGRGVRSAVTGLGDLLDPRVHPGEEGITDITAGSMIAPGIPAGLIARPAYRTLRAPYDAVRQAADVPGALHDINAAPDPLGIYAHEAQETAGQGAGQALLALATEGLTRGLTRGVRAIPLKSRAAANFNTVKTAAGDIPIDTSKVGDAAFEVQQKAQSGGRMPKVVNDFIRRATDPKKGPITYNEARDFYSNASKLSVDEMNRLTPVMKRQVGQFTRELGRSTQGAAEQGGVGPEYKSAMKEYRNAARMREGAGKAVKYGVPLALGGGIAARAVRGLIHH